MEILVDFFNFLSEMAEKQPVVLILIIIIMIVCGWLLWIRKSSNSDGYDHKEKTGLLDLTAQALAEQREQRAVLKEQTIIHEKHQAERIAAQDRTTVAVKEQTIQFTTNFKNFGETLDLTHAETMVKLGNIEGAIAEIKEFIKRFPEMENKVDNILRMLEEMRENVIN